MNVEAYAKINLSLDVLKKRGDGYHEVKMVMQSLSLHDTIEIIKTREKGIRIELLNKEGEFAGIPTDERNLIFKAAKEIAEGHGIGDGLLFKLTKRIPVAAGLAGGSADAAAVIRGLNDMYCLDLTMGDLMRAGKKIGADVPFCIMGGTALAEGIGEKLTRLKPAPACRVLLVKPKEGVSTREVYERLGINERPSFMHADVNRACEAIENGNLKKMAASLANILESVTVSMRPEIDHIKKKMLEEGALGSLMSGSGPTVFGLFSDPGLLDRAYDVFISEKERNGVISDVIKTGFYRIKAL